MCSKMAFGSRAEVKAFMREDAVNHKRGNARHGHAYLCRTCGAWHWSSMSKSEARRRGLA
jgi:hypothetical protein